MRFSLVFFMQVKLLNDLIQEIAGEQAVGVIDIIFGKRDVNEFLIAKKMDLTINQVRNIFYKLANFGLVSFTRKKDKRKGWYTYFWTLETYRALELLENRILKEIDILKNQLQERETKRFYICKICHAEVREETAILHDFICQECGEVYELSESEKIVAILKSKIEKLTKQRNDVFNELEIMRQEKEIQRQRNEKKGKKKKPKKKMKKKSHQIIKKILKSKKKLKKPKSKKKKPKSKKKKPKKKPVKKKRL